MIVMSILEFGMTGMVKGLGEDDIRKIFEIAS